MDSTFKISIFSNKTKIKILSSTFNIVSLKQTRIKGVDTIQVYKTTKVVQFALILITNI